MANALPPNVGAKSFARVRLRQPGRFLNHVPGKPLTLFITPPFGPLVGPGFGLLSLFLLFSLPLFLPLGFAFHVVFPPRPPWLVSVFNRGRSRNSLLLRLKIVLAAGQTFQNRSHT